MKCCAIDDAADFGENEGTGDKAESYNEEPNTMATTEGIVAKRVG